jgi:hypothetical protein
MKKVIKSLIIAILYSSAAVGMHANASLLQINMSFDNDASSWGVYTHLNGGGYVATDAANARSGTKSGFVYSLIGWSGIGRNVVMPAWNIRNYYQCAAGIYSKGLASYFEVIDTATWTYLRPIAHNSGSSSYKKILSGSWTPPRSNVYLRYVANADLAGSFTYAYIDDAAIQCLY